ncbi:MAG TPA: TonB-dependent receptor, partial [Chitinophagaceae bacterium]|nr:TonB-dependent receptor [Chitinophagaceae bacterium]
LDDTEKLNLDFKNTKLEDVLKSIFKDKKINIEQRGSKLLLNEQKTADKTVANISDAPVEKSTGTKERIIKGQVMDTEGNPFVGATVIVKGKPGRATITDELGIFSINAELGDVLVVTMVGMQDEEITVKSNSVLKIALKIKSDKLNEVVVVGYGKQKKVTVTGAIASVNMEDMQTPVRSLTNALAGKVAGVISMQTGGEPGYDNPTFTIRGIGTFTGNTSPLIIIDGVQRDDVNSTYGGAFNNIDPEDIASISLLKDASATAVYGTKGGNGVLIITTKKGVAGKPQISMKVETGISGFTKTPKMLDGVNYMKLLNEARQNMGETPAYTDEIIQKTASGLDPHLYPNVDWIKTIYKDWGQMVNANVNVSGGGEAMRYYISASFYNQDGSYKVTKVNGYDPNINFKRYDFRSNIDVNITKSTLLSLNLDAMIVNSRYPGNSASSIWYSAYATNPIVFPVSYPGGKWAGPRNNGGSNPFNLVQNAGYSAEFRPTIQSILTLNQKLDGITNGLSAMGRFSFDSYGEFNNRRSGNNDLWYAGSRDASGNLVYEHVRTGSTYLDYSSSSSGERVMYLEGNIAYDRSFGKHRLGGLLLYNMRNRLIGSAGSLKTSIPFRNQSFAGRITYSYMDKYLAEVNAGATGSENFEKGQRWGYFPAVSAGWVISKEAFFEPLSGTINFFKIRASHGVTGNDQIGTSIDDRFGYLTYIGGGASAAFGVGPTFFAGITESVLGTENLRWEKSAKDNIGLEIGLLKKINIVVDAFRDKRKDILITRSSISPIAGYSNLTIYSNLGEMENKGLDGSIEYNDQFGKNISLRLFGNFTYAKNKILFADQPKRTYAYQQWEGHRFGEFTGYVDRGLFVDQGDVDKSPLQTRTVFPGDIKYSDLNEDGVINDYDWKYLGKSSFPSWSYGMGFTVGYKKLDLSLFFQGVADVAIMANGTYITSGDGSAPGVGIVPFAGIGQYPANVLANVTNRWTEANPSQNVDYPRLTIANTTDNNYVNSTWWMKDGSFLRLKQASVGYELFSSTIKRAGFSSLYFYLSGQNLITFSKFKLWDPELGSNGAKYPLARTVTLGVRAKF